MPVKQIFVLATEAGLAIAVWYFSRPEDERQRVHAGYWRELERLSMRLAKSASNFAAYAERRYKETVSA